MYRGGRWFESTAALSDGAERRIIPGRLSRQPHGGHAFAEPSGYRRTQRIWRGRRLSTGGHWRSRWDTEGHDIRPVRDCEAPGSNPGPPTKPSLFEPATWRRKAVMYAKARQARRPAGPG